MRWLRHLFSAPWHVRRCFTPDALSRIERAILESEGAHLGELRFAVEPALAWPDLLRGKSARDRALEVFSSLRVWDTEHNSGVLIYLLLADHDVEIVADRGIDAKVGTAGWEEVCRRMEARFRAGEFEAGVLEGVASITTHLQRHFPMGDNANPDELNNTPVIL